MLTLNERMKIGALMRREIVPAIGCTEPVSVALCTARAVETLENFPDRIEVSLSTNVVKNAMGVGIPGTGMTGLPIAIALGAIAGKSAYGLEVLKDITADDVEKGKKMIAEGKIHIGLEKNEPDKLFIRVSCESGKDWSEAIICGDHTSFVFVAKNGHTLLEKSAMCERKDESDHDVKLTFKKVYDFAIESPLGEIDFILDAAKMNREAAEAAKNDTYGHNVSATILSEKGRNVFGDNLHSRMVAATAGACDVRMSGAMVPVMSNSGSGNQGIAATLPVLTYAENIDCSEEQLIRALTLSNLCMIYIKQYLGRLSALCGCVVASTGACCGITRLMGGSYEQITYAAKNMIADITGMICDGAKPSCALKIASGVSTATLSALMAVENKVVSSQEGIIDDDIDQTIRNLARIGNKGMAETDKIVLDIMTKK